VGVVGLALVGTLTACGQASIAGLTAKQADLLDYLMHRLGSQALLRDPLVVAPPADSSHVPVFANSEGFWLQLQSDATASVDRFEANWQGRIVLSAFGYELHKAGDDSMKGGGLSFSTPAEGFGLSQWFDPDYSFTNAEGKLSRQVVSGSDVRRSIRVGAAHMGLAIQSVAIFSVSGTDVKVVATTSDKSFGQHHPNYFYELLGDPGALEGALVIVTDLRGELVTLAGFATRFGNGDFVGVPLNHG